VWQNGTRWWANNLGPFEHKIDAARAWDDQRRAKFGRYAHCALIINGHPRLLNFPTEAEEIFRCLPVERQKEEDGVGLWACWAEEVRSVMVDTRRPCDVRCDQREGQRQRAKDGFFWGQGRRCKGAKPTVKSLRRREQRAAAAAAAAVAAAAVAGVEEEEEEEEEAAQEEEEAAQEGEEEQAEGQIDGLKI
jgi:hypothetical protein